MFTRHVAFPPRETNFGQNYHLLNTVGVLPLPLQPDKIYNQVGFLPWRGLNAFWDTSPSKSSLLVSLLLCSFANSNFSALNTTCFSSPASILPAPFIVYLEKLPVSLLWQHRPTIFKGISPRNINVPETVHLYSFEDLYPAFHCRK